MSQRSSCKVLSYLSRGWEEDGFGEAAKGMIALRELRMTSEEGALHLEGPKNPPQRLQPSKYPP